MENLAAAELAAILPSLAWFLFALVALLLFQKTLRDLLHVAIWRIKTGSPLKIASFELGASYVSPQADFANKGKTFAVRVDENDERYTERKHYYEPNRYLFLVHRIAPSKQPNQLYDILIYLIPHHEHAAGLASVRKVEYYFGKSWGKRIFTSIDRANSFAISTSAYGAFVCTAKVYFADDSTQPEMLWRYIDFEMGSIGKEPINQEG
jgi:hypothetical protein